MRSDSHKEQMLAMLTSLAAIFFLQGLSSLPLFLALLGLWIGYLGLFVLHCLAHRQLFYVLHLLGQSRKQRLTASIRRDVLTHYLSLLVFKLIAILLTGQLDFWRFIGLCLMTLSIICLKSLLFSYLLSTESL